MGAILGLDCRLYYAPAGTTTWGEWKCVKDASVSLTYDEVDSTCRGAAGFKFTTPTLANIEVTGTAVKEKADTSFVAIDAAAKAKTILAFLVMDGDRTLATSDGWIFDGQIMSWVEDQNLADVVQMSFTIKPARSLNPVQAVTGPQ